MHLRTLLCTAALLLWACYDSSFGEPDTEPDTGVASTTIRKLCDSHLGTTYLITTDIRLRGVVTTSDRSKNFYRTFCIEQDGAGLELMAGLDHLHNDFPVGCQITLNLKGLAVGISYGVLQIGYLPSAGSGYATDYLGSPAALRAACTRNGETMAPVAPALYPINALKPALCGTLVRIDGLRYTPEDLSTGTWAGYKRFTDDHGAEIFTYVRSYATFADNEVPVGKCALTGILQYDGRQYSLKLRDENDCVY